MPPEATITAWARSVNSPVTLRELLFPRATLSGSTSNLNLEASGGALPDLGGLPATNATVNLSGGVVASIAVSDSLKGSASGGVVLTLTTQPASSDVETSGGAVLRNP